MRIIVLLPAALLACAHAPTPVPATPTAVDAARSGAQLAHIWLLTSEAVLAVNSTAAALAEWTEALEREVSAHAPGAQVVVQVGARRGHADVLELVVRPPPAPAAKEKLAAALRAHPAPVPRVASYAIRLSYNPTGEREREPWDGGFESPDERALAELASAPLSRRLALVRDWVTDDALPVLGHVASNVDERFAGVRAMGALTRGLARDAAIDVRANVDRSREYWRGVAEMARGQQLVVAIRLCLLVGEGRVDEATRLLQLVLPAATEGGVATDLLEQLAARLQLVQAEVNRRVGEGIALHDEERYAEAVAIYDAVLAEHPHSASALWELNQSLVFAKSDRAGWSELGRRLYTADPMYPLAFVASGPEQIARVQRRVALTTLFRDGDAFLDDLRAFADIALDLDEHVTAAHAYWLLLQLARSEDEVKTALEHAAFAFDRLGASFLGDALGTWRVEAFARVEAARQKRLWGRSDAGERPAPGRRDAGADRPPD